ncbi:hypothetical protein COO60DRAFT_1617026 [Scenedesmus sp. NREL 46B-D3]|nr:hypothetical protein COO60DRAFT_1617026 [Scenedesmus sp. NREL 46B-D3]
MPAALAELLLQPTARTVQPGVLMLLLQGAVGSMDGVSARVIVQLPAAQSILVVARGLDKAAITATNTGSYNRTTTTALL